MNRIKVNQLAVGDRVRVRLGRESKFFEGVVTYAEHGRRYLQYPVPVSAYAPDGVGRMRISHRHAIELLERHGAAS